ncbi:MAG: hypothetical protein M3R65_10955 [Gemmatimonadota bacterium]|nr:hypothetical protein [Gemmatimonadota bacterium]
MTAMIVGTMLAIAVLCFVLYPLFREPLGIGVMSALPPRTALGVTTAVEALREIEFDHATGKLSDVDYAELRSSYTQSAVTAMRDGGAGPAQPGGVICEHCGPRPEADAVYCSECGHALAA